MKEEEKSAPESDWTCCGCGEVLVLTKVRVSYLGTTLSVDLPVCPRCGVAMVDEEAAMGKMAEAERLLEDK